MLSLILMIVETSWPPQYRKNAIILLAGHNPDPE